MLPIDKMCVWGDSVVIKPNLLEELLCMGTRIGNIAHVLGLEGVQPNLGNVSRRVDVTLCIHADHDDIVSEWWGIGNRIAQNLANHLGIALRSKDVLKLLNGSHCGLRSELYEPTIRSSLVSALEFLICCLTVTVEFKVQGRIGCVRWSGVHKCDS